MAITQSFSTPPTPPSSLDKTNFRVRYDNFLSYIQTLGNNLVNFITQLNSTETNINAQATIALNAQTIAASSANFQGNWLGTINYSIGQSVAYNGIIYRSLTGNINQNPSSSTVNWIPVSPTYGNISSTFSTAGGSWYRIAQSAIGQGPVDGIFSITWRVAGDEGTVRFSASSFYGTNQCISQLVYSCVGTKGITAARIVYNTTAAGNYTYLEIMFAGSLTNVWVSTEVIDITGWSLLPQSTIGAIPTGYISFNYSFKSSITPGTYSKISVDSDGIVIGGDNALGIGVQQIFSANFTIGASNCGHLLLLNSGCSTVTLPAINSIQNGNTIILRNVQINPVNISLNGNLTDLYSLKVGGGETIILQSDGGSFYRLITRSGRTPAYDDLNTTIAYNSVYQAASDLKLIVLLVGSYQNGAQIVVGNTNVPTRVVAQTGDDISTNTKYSYMQAEIGAGTYFAVQPYGPSGFESITCIIYQYR